MLPKDDASHDKTCQGSSSLKRMTDVTPAPAVSGLSLAVMLESVFTEGYLGHPGTPQDPARVLPLGFVKFVGVLTQGSNIFWNWRNFTASLGASVGSCPSLRLHSSVSHQFPCGRPRRPSSNRSPDALLETRRRGRFGRVDMTGSYFCMSSPPAQTNIGCPTVIEMLTYQQVFF